MFSNKKTEAAVEPTVVQPVDVSVYAMSKGAERIRALEVEIVAAFEEWAQVQRSLADNSLMAEFKFSPVLEAAWAAWRRDKYRTNHSEAVTEVTNVR